MLLAATSLPGRGRGHPGKPLRQAAGAARRRHSSWHPQTSKGVQRGAPGRRRRRRPRESLLAGNGPNAPRPRPGGAKRDNYQAIGADMVNLSAADAAMGVGHLLLQRRRCGERLHEQLRVCGRSGDVGYSRGRDGGWGCRWRRSGRPVDLIETRAKFQALIGLTPERVLGQRRSLRHSSCCGVVMRMRVPMSCRGLRACRPWRRWPGGSEHPGQRSGWVVLDGRRGCSRLAGSSQ